MRLCIPLLGAVVAGVFSGTNPQAPMCHSGDDFMAWILFNQRQNLGWYARHNSWTAAYWQRAGLSPSDTARIVPVTNDSICARAALAVNRDRNLPDTTTRQIYMITEGRYFLALDPKLVGGEFHTAYLLDSTVTKVVQRIAM